MPTRPDRAEHIPTEKDYITARLNELYETYADEILGPAIAKDVENIMENAE